MSASVQVVGLIGGLGLQWQASFAIITLLYFYSHYLFASGAAHIGAMYTAFLSVSIAMGTPPLVVRPVFNPPKPFCSSMSAIQ